MVDARGDANDDDDAVAAAEEDEAGDVEAVPIAVARGECTGGSLLAEDCTVAFPDASAARAAGATAACALVLSTSLKITGLRMMANTPFWSGAAIDTDRCLELSSADGEGKNGEVIRDEVEEEEEEEGESDAAK